MSDKMTDEEAIEALTDKSVANLYLTLEALDIAVDALRERAGRKTGKWIDASGKLDREIGKRHDFVCPNCKRFARDFIAGVGDWWCSDAPEYCPNCGAKMEVKNADSN